MGSFDVDKSGLLEFDEFFQCIKLRAFPNAVGEGLAMRIFVETDVSNTASLSLSEFTQGLKKFDEAICNSVLFRMQFSPGHIAAIVVMLITVLLVVFGFIFTGIAAFATAGAFS